MKLKKLHSVLHAGYAWCMSFAVDLDVYSHSSACSQYRYRIVISHPPVTRRIRLGSNFKSHERKEKIGLKDHTKEQRNHEKNSELKPWKDTSWNHECTLGTTLGPQYTPTNATVISLLNLKMGVQPVPLTTTVQYDSDEWRIKRARKSHKLEARKEDVLIFQVQEYSTRTL